MRENQTRKYIKKSAGLLAALLFAIAAPEAITAEAQDTSQTILYEVQPGDTLFSSARAYGKKIDGVATLNNLPDANRIHPGQVLVIEGTASELAGLKSTHSNYEFIEIVGNHARNIAQVYGLYPSVMASQAALESNYGKSTLASPPFHNLYGIKGGINEDTVVMSTSEFIDGQWIHPDEKFKKYPNYEESMQDNAKLLRNGNSWAPEYYAGAWVENSESYLDATASLKGRYATDPDYDQKLEGIIDEYNLTRFDAEHNPSPSENEPPTGETHKVSRGDTLYNIANRYQMTVTELQNLNGLSSNNIQLDQTLQVRNKNQSNATDTTHPVGVGDTLYNIANRYQMTVAELQNLNGLSSNNIQLGQSLQVRNTNQIAPASHTHTVGPGDTLYNISNRYNLTVSELQQLNQLSSNEIQIGQTLNVSGEAPQTHTVQPGDTLYNIANRYNTTVDHLKVQNDLSSNAIQLGQTLEIK